MRPDMGRVIIESGRAGGLRDTYKPRRAGDEYENYPKHEGMRRQWKDHKAQTDRLNPLWRYLDKQVGRPWNAVWSDISAHLDFRSVIGFHLKSHLDHHVERHARIIDGHPHRVALWWQRGWTPLRAGELYVHPDHGLLCRAKAQKGGR